MGKSSPPPAPDYKAAAEATSQGNLDMARLTTKANRVNSNTPFGSLTYTQDPNDPDKWTSNVTLSPDEQKLLDANLGSSLSLANLQGQGAQRVADSLSGPLDLSKLPSGGTALQGHGAIAMPDTYDPSTTPKLAGYYDPTSDTNTATQAIMSRLAPQIEREGKSLDQSLANQGLTPGSEAYNTAKTLQAQSANDREIQAALQGIDLGMRQQGQTFNQSLQGAGLNMAQQAQQYGQQANNVGMTMNDQRLMDQEQAQQFAQAQALRQQGLSETLLGREQPLNELNALRTGSQVTMPTFQNAPQQANVSGPNYMGAAQAQYGASMDAYNAGQAQDMGLMNGIVGLGKSALPFMLSDIRVKRNVEFVGRHKNGFNVYRYDNLATGKRELGVIAQELSKTHPHAVRRRHDGLLEVNYGEIL